MKTILLMVAGAIGLYFTARRFNITSVEDVKQLITKLVGDLNLSEMVNVDKIKSMLTMEEEELVTV